MSSPEFYEDGKTAITPKTSCPSCGHALDAASTFRGGEVPSPGDFTACLHCGKWMKFTDTLDVVPATIEELNAQALNIRREMSRVNQFVRRFRKHEAAARDVKRSIGVGGAAPRTDSEKA